jgi:hypothetical protein
VLTYVCVQCVEQTFGAAAASVVVAAHIAYASNRAKADYFM